ncbi:Craniofacial development protein 2 [Eumeta japonica]|uniref:Craniofacial development protein 2 n=1 Tax=Eumeta variegata TaxID=151549 RepID=A0A4C1ZFX5_EUMVA|nr:Craniofacial development protein 2 [Eumeta japonica]
MVSRFLNPEKRGQAPSWRSRSTLTSAPPWVNQDERAAKLGCSLQPSEEVTDRDPTGKPPLLIFNLIFSLMCADFLINSYVSGWQFICLNEHWLPIQVHAVSKEEIDKFYDTLQETHSQARESALVIGYFNDKVGLAKTIEDTILGKFGYGKRNERGEKLIEFAFEYKLSVMNTHFKMRHYRSWSWITRNEKKERS